MDERSVQRALLIAEHGIANSDACVLAEEKPGRPTLARCLALLENESGGRNAFGGEGTACPTRWYEGEVTHARYLVYSNRCQNGYSVNGVGPTQLTDRRLQLAADKLGGCWQPEANMDIGFHFLHQLIEQLGVREGFRAYNGSGPAADAYAERAIGRTNLWQQLLEEHGLA